MRVRGLLAGLRRRLPSGGSILCYHSVTGSDLPSASAVNVPIEELRATLDRVRQGGEAVPLRELVRRCQAGLSTAGLIAITFDDAYASLLRAGDVIARARIPITVFVVTNAARTGQRYWWDRVEDAYAGVTPQRWHAFENAIGLPRDYRAGQPASLGRLRPLRQWILAVHKGGWPDYLEQPLAELEADAGGTSRHRSMTFGELDQLVLIPGVEVGVHTQSHAVLPLLGNVDAEREIAGCHDILRERYGIRAAPLLAFPFGLFDRRTHEIARRAGMEATFGLGNRTVRGQPSVDVLPRFMAVAGEARWRLAFKTWGVLEQLRRVRGDVAPDYPALPSPTS
jgi:peptidoglycan/xylan/chitin deacetylase (PgdA/CDA1 family)